MKPSAENAGALDGGLFGADANLRAGGAAARKVGKLKYFLGSHFIEYLIDFLCVGIAYFAAAKIGLALATINASATPIWPPTGMALAAVLLRGYAVCPAIFLAAFLTNETTAGSIYTSLAIALGNTLEGVAGGWLVNRWSGGVATFDTPLGVIRFALASLVFATPISATIGVGSLDLAGFVEPDRLDTSWITWWLGDAAGALVIAPVAVLWLRSVAEPFDRTGLAETALVYAIAGAIGVVGFSALFEQTANRSLLSFLAILPLLWAALRRSQRDTATVSLIISCFAVWGTLRGGGPFFRGTLNESFLLLVTFMLSIALPSLVLSADVAVRRQMEEHQRTLLAELNHRVMNMLATVQSIAMQSVRGAASPADLQRNLTQRLHALSQAYDLLSREAWEGAPLDEVVRIILAPYGKRCVAIEGPAVRLARNAAVTLTMAFHELATNAAKYGALSALDGRVSVSWAVDSRRGPALEVRWAESGGPAIVPPVRRGFGLRLIEDAMAHEFEAKVKVEFPPSGVVCCMRLPMSARLSLE